MNFQKVKLNSVLKKKENAMFDGPKINLNFLENKKINKN